MIDKLVEAYEQRRLILFVGAGVSKNLGLPTWSELLGHMAGQLGFDPRVFETYGNQYTLAQYYRLKKRGTLNALTSWMISEWHNKNIDVRASRVHELIAKLGVDLIYTTNYDHWIEEAFAAWEVPACKIASVEHLTDMNREATQIVKLHGDLTEGVHTIVLDEESYFERLQFESPLDIKLRADVLGRSVLFLGYSLSDINVRLLFHKLSKLWKNAHAPSQPPSFFFSSRPNPIQEETLANWNIKVISSDYDNPKEALIELLEKLLLKRHW